jgi:hypothetical protein
MEAWQSFGLSNSRMTHETILCPEARVARVTKSGTKPSMFLPGSQRVSRSILAGICCPVLSNEHANRELLFIFVSRFQEIS